MKSVVSAALPQPPARWPEKLSGFGISVAGWSRTGCLPRLVQTDAAVCVAAAVAVALLASPAMAEPPPGAPADIPTVINNLRLWLVGLLAACATLFLTVGGLRYMTAGGDPSEVERSKGALKAAAIGYAIAVLAPVLLAVLQGIVGS